MPAFFKSLFGSGGSKDKDRENSTSSSSRKGQSSSSSSSRRSSAATIEDNNQQGRVESAASSTSSLAQGQVKGQSSKSSLRNSHPSSSSSSSAPPPISTGGAGSGASTSGAVPIGIPIHQTTSRNTTNSSVGGASSAGNITGDEEDLDPVPETPFSSGHSPSHARHRFPSPTKQQSSGSSSTGNAFEENEESSTGDGNGGGGPGGMAGKSPASGASLSSLSGTTSKSNNGRPDIPTTQTILANPLPQPSSGLAASLSALSSVLPTTSSATYSTSSISNTANNGSKPSPTSANNGNGDGPRTFDIDDMIARLLEAGYSSKLTKSVCLKNSEIVAICSAAREVFLSQPTLLELSPPVKIVGDVHGQYADLIRLFEMCGFPPKSNYLFLGDYVDRGKQSLETILLLLCYKVKYPENFFLLRGNHECANVTRVYGFYDECKRRCNIKIWKTFIDVFNCLPITAIVASKIFCVHGGLSPSLSNMDDIRRIARPTDVPDYGLLNDLLWSDPSDTALDWEDNERGVSYCFGKAVIQDFLHKYDFDLICRAHMVVEDGYEFWNERTLVTIFSAPNYCGEFDNFGAVCAVSADLLCSFELIKPLDGPALKKELAKSRRKNSAGLITGGTTA